MHLLILAAVVLIVTTAPLAEAQIFRVPRVGTMPAAWTSLAVGFYDVGAVRDGSTGSTWDFGSSVQYRGTFEMDLNNGNGGVGLALGYADVPLRYFAGAVNGPAACLSGCDAGVKVWTTMATFHMGGSRGFHQVIDISAGATFYREFQRDDGGELLAPLHGDTDVSLSVGYGFGYAFTTRVALTLVQDVAYTLHQREGLSGNDRSYSQQRTTRIGLRYGVGSR